MQGCEVVFHQAAHKAVLRSVELPLVTDTANTHGTLTVLKAALDAGVRRVVHASSSSVYGGAATLPTTEDEPMHPRSPYAVTKLAAEHYCRVFSELYGLETVGAALLQRIRPPAAPRRDLCRRDPALRRRAPRGRDDPVVHGDGLQSRDFTFISDVVAANLAAARAPADRCAGRAFNIAGGSSATLLDVLAILADLLGVTPRPQFVDARPGDVRHSRADATAAARDLGFRDARTARRRAPRDGRLAPQPRLSLGPTRRCSTASSRRSSTPRCRSTRCPRSTAGSGSCRTAGSTSWCSASSRAASAPGCR